VSIVPLRGKNITGTETFSVPLVLKSKEEEIKENNVLARGLGGCRTLSSFALNTFPYTCNIQFVSSASLIAVKDLFLVKPRFDIVTGEFCVHDEIQVVRFAIMISFSFISQASITAISRQ